MLPATIQHARYAQKLFISRFIKHADLKLILSELTAGNLFKVAHIGNSVQGRQICQVTVGTGKTNILLWSQMHGDEHTGTLAFFDLFNFFAAADEHDGLRNTILSNCTLHFVPMLNPDGAAMHQRRNAQGIDINRDFLAQQTPEARILTQLHAAIKPDLCFNMHDQETLWSVAGSKQPASISLLAPPPDEAATVTDNRLKAMQIIAGINEYLEDKIPGSVGRWSEEYEPRAFGDNFQKLGSATLLLEAGGYDQDIERQHVRKLTFEILLHAFHLIATQQYSQQQISNYYRIPVNSKDLFHLLIKDCRIMAEGATITADIGLNYTELIDLENFQHTKIYTVADIGDLSTWNAYDIVEAAGGVIGQVVTLGARPDIDISDKNGDRLVLQNGIRVH